MKLGRRTTNERTYIDHWHIGRPTNVLRLVWSLPSRPNAELYGCTADTQKVSRKSCPLFLDGRTDGVANIPIARTQIRPGPSVRLPLASCCKVHLIQLRTSQQLLKLHPQFQQQSP